MRYLPLNPDDPPGTIRYTLDPNVGDCRGCGRKIGDPWPKGFAHSTGLLWITEHECVLCYDERMEREKQNYKKAVETLLGKFSQEQFDALLLVLRSRP